MRRRPIAPGYPQPRPSLARGWGRPIQPTVQALGGGKTFEQWLDELDGPAREAFDEALAEQDADPAQRRPDGTA
jgi:hypothetical protein